MKNVDWVCTHMLCRIRSFWLGPKSGMRSPVSHKPLPLGMKRTCFCKKEPARNEIKCVYSTCCWLGLALLFRFHAQLSVSSWTPESDEEEKWCVIEGVSYGPCCFVVRVSGSSRLRQRIRCMCEHCKLSLSATISLSMLLQLLMSGAAERQVVWFMKWSS